MPEQTDKPGKSHTYSAHPVWLRSAQSTRFTLHHRFQRQPICLTRSTINQLCSRVKAEYKSKIKTVVKTGSNERQMKRLVWKCLAKEARELREILIRWNIKDRNELKKCRSLSIWIGVMRSIISRYLAFGCILVINVCFSNPCSVWKSSLHGLLLRLSSL